jgi:hypothetical protein
MKVVPIQILRRLIHGFPMEWTNTLPLLVPTMEFQTFAPLPRNNSFVMRRHAISQPSKMNLHMV